MRGKSEETQRLIVMGSQYKSVGGDTNMGDNVKKPWMVSLGRGWIHVIPIFEGLGQCRQAPGRNVTPEVPPSFLSLLAVFQFLAKDSPCANLQESLNTMPELCHHLKEPVSRSRTMELGGVSPGQTNPGLGKNPK